MESGSTIRIPDCYNPFEGTERGSTRRCGAYALACSKLTVPNSDYAKFDGGAEWATVGASPERSRSRPGLVSLTMTVIDSCSEAVGSEVRG